MTNAIKQIVARLAQTAASPEEIPDPDETTYEEMLSFVRDPKNLPALKAAFKGRRGFGFLYPSGWYSKKPYPGVLAELLVHSSSVESITDLTNPYYNRNRVLSPEAKKIFEDNVFANVKEALLVAVFDKLEEALVPQGFMGYCKAEKATARRMLLKLSKADLAALTSKESDYQEGWASIFKFLGLNP